MNNLKKQAAREIRVIVVLIVAFGLALSSIGYTLASDITGALFSGTLRITDSGGTASGVSTNFSLNTTALIANGYAKSDLSDVAIRNGSDDVAFMPGYGSNPWVVYVPTIGSGQNLNYGFYTNNVTGGKIRYFPGPAGMSTADYNTGTDNWSKEIKGRFDGTGIISSKYDHALGGYTITRDTSGNITASIFAANHFEYLRPTANGDEISIPSVNPAVAHWVAVSDSDNASYVSSGADTNYHRDLYTLADGGNVTKTISSVTMNWTIEGAAGGTWYAKPAFKIGGVSYNGTEQSAAGDAAWHDLEQVWTTSPATGLRWTWAEVNAIQVGMNIKTSNAAQPVYLSELWIVVEYATSVSAAVSSDEHDVYVGLDSPFYGMTTDGTSPIFPVSSNLVANIPLGNTELSGTTFTTIDNHAYPCTVSGTTWNSLGRVFNGTTDNISIPSLTLGGYPQASWEYWEKVASFANINRTITEYGLDNSYIIDTLGVGNDNVRVWMGGHSDSIDNVFILNTWTNITVTYNAGTVKIYKNGSYLGTLAGFPANIPVSLDRVILGNSANGAIGGLNGTLGGIRIYDRELTATEALQNFNALSYKYLSTGTDNHLLSTKTTVPDNASPVIDCEAAAVPCMEYSKTWVGGVLEQDVPWKYGPVFTDLSGKGHDATPTFPTTSSNANVSAQLLSLQPTTQSQLITTSVASTPETFGADASAPPEMYTEGDYSYIPVAAVINVFLDLGGIPYALYYFPIIFILAALLGMMIYGPSRSLLMQCIVSCVCMAIPAVMGPIMLWPAILSWIPFGAIMLSTRHYGWG